MTTSGIRAADGGRASFVSSAGRVIAALLLAVFVSGCAAQTGLVSTIDPPNPGSSPKVLVMTPDIEIAVLTAGGLLEPNAEWTEQAKDQFKSSLAEVLGEKSVTLVAYQEIETVGPESLAEGQVLKLHETVGAAIRYHKGLPALNLPTKEDKFDWTLGESIKPLRERYDADYIIFIHLRDSFSSAGRVAANVVFALLGAGVHGGQQTGYVSLVNMKTGHIVWFNGLFSQSGDLRTKEGSLLAIKTLLGPAPL